MIEHVPVPSVSLEVDVCGRLESCTIPRLGALAKCIQWRPDGRGLLTINSCLKALHDLPDNRHSELTPSARAILLSKFDTDECDSWDTDSISVATSNGVGDQWANGAPRHFGQLNRPALTPKYERPSDIQAVEEREAKTLLGMTAAAAKPIIDSSPSPIDSTRHFVLRFSIRRKLLSRKTMLQSVTQRYPSLSAYSLSLSQISANIQ